MKQEFAEAAIGIFIDMKESEFDAFVTAVLTFVCLNERIVF